MELPDGALTELIKYKPIKWLFVAILAVVLMMFVYAGFNHAYRCNHKLNSTLLWGLNECTECIVIDSLAAVPQTKISNDQFNTNIKEAEKVNIGNNK